MNKPEEMGITAGSSFEPTKFYKIPETHTNVKTNGNDKSTSESNETSEKPVLTLDSQSNDLFADYDEESLNDIRDKRIKFRTEVLGFSKEDAEEWTQENIEKMKEIRAKMRVTDFSVVK